MADTGFFRASSVEITGGESISGENNLILENIGDFSANVIQGTDSDPIAVTLNFTDFFIPDGNKVTGIQFILGGSVAATGFAFVPAPTIQAGTLESLADMDLPQPTLINGSGLVSSVTPQPFTPAIHTYTLDTEYSIIEEQSQVQTTINATIIKLDTINQIIGDTPGKIVKLTVKLDAFAGSGTLQLDGTNPGGGFTPLPAIKIFYESLFNSKVKIQAQSKVKIQQQPDIFDGDLIINGSHTKIKLI